MAIRVYIWYNGSTQQNSDRGVCMSKEWIESNYIEALLRAALVIGDKNQEKPVREVIVAGYKMDGENGTIQHRCKMTVQDEDASSGEDHLILYRM